MSLSACLEEEGIQWLRKYLKNAQVTLMQVRFGEVVVSPGHHPAGVVRKGYGPLGFCPGLSVAPWSEVGESSESGSVPDGGGRGVCPDP